jgi:hypothetical protein
MTRVPDEQSFAVVAAIIYAARCPIEHKETGSEPDMAECVNDAYDMIGLCQQRTDTAKPLTTRFTTGEG